MIHWFIEVKNFKISGTVALELLPWCILPKLLASSSLLTRDKLIFANKGECIRATVPGQHFQGNSCRSMDDHWKWWRAWGGRLVTVSSSIVSCQVRCIVSCQVTVTATIITLSSWCRDWHWGSRWGIKFSIKIKIKIQTRAHATGWGNTNLKIISISKIPS